MSARRSGHSRLVYDKTTRSIVSVATGMAAASLEMRDALAGLLGLTELLLGRDDLPAQVREALQSNHRVGAAREVLSKTTS